MQLFDFEELDCVCESPASDTSEDWSAQVQQGAPNGRRVSPEVDDTLGAVKKAAIGAAAVTRVLGICVDSAEVSQAVLTEWAMVNRGRDIFWPGWGGFDINVAYRAFLEGAGQASWCATVPGVGELRSHGYLQKFFPGVFEPMQRERLRRVLDVPASDLAQYVVRYHAFWSDPAHANRLDEVDVFFRSSGSLVREVPRALLNRLSRDGAVMGHRLVYFHHLTDAFDPVRLAAKSRGEAMEYVELLVLQNSHAVARAAQELNNCAADYVGNVRRKQCALVVLQRQGKLQAMGEWDLHNRRWSQISEHCDEPARPEWQRLFDDLAGPQLLPVLARLKLPGAHTNVISIFGHAAVEALRPLCRWTGISCSLVVGLREASEMCACQPEAAGALLLGCAEYTERCGIARSLLVQAADPDTMTDDGWTILMLAAQAGRAELVMLLLEATADMDARGAGGGRTALMIAVCGGEIALVQMLVESRSNVDLIDRTTGKTALVMAIEASHWEAAELLIRCGACLAARRYDGKTALILAAGAGHTKVVSLLAELCADLDSQSDNGSYALLEAAVSSRWAVARTLVAHGASMNVGNGSCSKTPLMLASAAGQQELVELLVAGRAALEAAGHRGATALLAAAMSQQWDTVKWLAERKAQLDARMEDGTTVPVLAAEVGKMDVMRFLVEHGISVGPVLVWAAARGRVQLIQALSEMGVDLNAAGFDGDTALSAATGAKKWQTVQLLAELDVNLESRGSLSSTALIAAAKDGQIRTLRCLLERRAALEARTGNGSVDGDGVTALLMAVQECRWEVVRLLVHAQADLDPGEGRVNARSVMMQAAEMREWDVVNLLARRFPDAIHGTGTGGRTALMCAASSGQAEVVWKLLQCRARAEATCDLGLSALGHAALRAHTEIMRTLWEHGCHAEADSGELVLLTMRHLIMEWQGVDLEAEDEVMDARRLCSSPTCRPV